MATTPRARETEYPTSDGKPMAETQTHAQNMMDLIQTLQDHFSADPDVYVWGDLLMFYEEGDRRKHVSPDVFFVRGVAKRVRENYLVWEEGKGPDVVIEITSRSTSKKDEGKKLELYRDVLKVPEYFLFDPFEEYLKPSMKGYRLRRGRYVPADTVLGRLPSNGLGLHLERDGAELRLFDPATGRRLRTPREDAAEAQRAATEAQRAATESQRAATEALAENERLRREVEELRRRLSGS